LAVESEDDSRVLNERFRQNRVDYRNHWSGWLLPVRAAPGEGYTVHGIVRRTSNMVRSRIEHLRRNEEIYDRRLFLHYGDLADSTTLRRIISDVRPTELYHLAGQSHVGLSFEIPESTCEEAGMATLRLLEIARSQPQPMRFYHASSSEIFGNASEIPQTEDTPLRPTSPYGCAKAFATQLARVYRESYGLFVCNGILYNHESPRRGENFVTRKIARAAARIARKLDDELVLGNLESQRDWGRAHDYVEAMWLMLQHKIADDYVVATGKHIRCANLSKRLLRLSIFPGKNM
jgi:GDPmannose 4,6-dehydratase